jgi:predicted Zn-dependent protease
MKKQWVWLAVILALGVGGFWLGRPLYRNWKQERLVMQAREALRNGDLRKAGLSARQANGVNPKNVDACRIMAEISESVRSPAAIEWRQRVVDLEPGSLTNRLALARCGILQGEYAQALRALQGVDKTNQNNVAFHQMAAMVAMSLNNIAAAERHFTEAARLDPGNKLLELNRAIIHLQAKDQQVVAGALKSLEQLYADPTYRKDALRHLAMAASRNKDYARAAVFTKELQADPKPLLSDRLMHLTVLKEGGISEFGAYLTTLEAACAGEAENANTLTAWLLGHGMADEAARWLASLPAELQDKTPVALARADCLMALGDWAGLQTLLKDAKWDGLDFMRLAMLARACGEQRQEFSAQTEWHAATRAAAEHPKQLGVLVSMANKWGWDKEKEEVLWILVERFPAERWALQSLSQTCLAAGNTRGLFKVYSKLVDREPANVAAMNNLASVSLLLNLQTNKACEMARDAYLKATNVAAFASTYAWSLHLQGRTAEGLKVLEALKPDRLEVPGVALYYGAMLAAVNAPAKAKKYLDLAETGQLLPEEKGLLADSRKRL